jgi:hypothetical protein
MSQSKKSSFALAAPLLLIVACLMSVANPVAAQITSHELQQKATNVAKLFQPQTTTNLMFYFVTSGQGWDTSVAIVNSTTTAGQCNLSLYPSGSASVPAQSVAAQNFVAFTLSGLGVSNFSGYMTASCNFAGARGWGMISPMGGRTAGASITVEVLQ